jgi:hypothetical protein
MRHNYELCDLIHSKERCLILDESKTEESYDRKVEIEFEYLLDIADIGD